MTRLLISVRDLAEAKLAFSNSADLIDLKEPTRGSLGRCDVDVWRQVSRYVGSRRPVSAALGELAVDFSAQQLGELGDFDFVKIGLAGCASVVDWEQRWAAVLDETPAGVRRVAVAYADHGEADSPAPREVLRVARRLDCHAILLDTFGKEGGHLFNRLDPVEIESLLEMARNSCMVTVLGGSLSHSTLDLALSLRPDFIALRGAVCSGDRRGRIDGSLVRDFAKRIKSFTAPERANRPNATAR